jgi:molybdopterin-binding protein
VLTIAEAARALGVSIDTIRRWDRQGKIAVDRDELNRRVVSEDEIRRLGGRTPSQSGGDISARNHLAGVITNLQVDGVMALVEIQAGPYRLVSLITRDAVEELGLAPGVEAVATIKATSVMVSRPSGKTTHDRRGFEHTP